MMLARSNTMPEDEFFFRLELAMVYSRHIDGVTVAHIIAIKAYNIIVKQKNATNHKNLFYRASDILIFEVYLDIIEQKSATSS